LAGAHLYAVFRCIVFVLVGRGLLAEHSVYS
jgi:hypothetical protein